MRDHTEILVCFQCKGSGTIGERELADYHRGEYDEWNVICKGCGGSGRQIKTTTITIEPYDNPEVSLIRLKETDKNI